MDPFVALPMFTVMGLLAVVSISSRMANQHPRRWGRRVTGLVGLQALIAGGLAVAFVLGGGGTHFMSWGNSYIEEILSIYYDGATSLMLLLVSFVGFVVARFSIRYLDGEADQGHYFRWLSFTLGAVSLMIIAGNLILFVAAWIMTSFGLHHLLLYYPQRKAARRAAWTKFAISRLGDSFLLGALILSYRTFGTFSFEELFHAAGALRGTAEITGSHAAIGWLFVLGAITKSAQFPFHVWLPDTMETPTPVSALMHAGIVNAGGYLVIRMSPLVNLAPSALATLALIGALTAGFAAVVMTTQASVKRTLAYSTIAQMGFMMLQCGLGAYTAAMLHILAHSLYKAHAFLGSGSVLTHSSAMSGSRPRTVGRWENFLYLLAALALAFGVCFMGTRVLGFDLVSKPGGIILGLILSLALTTWSWQLFAAGSRRTFLLALLAVPTLCGIYISGYIAVDYLLGPGLAIVEPTLAMQVAWVGVAIAFVTLFLLHVALMFRLPASWLAPLRVHAANGFYIDAIYQRAFHVRLKA